MHRKLFTSIFSLVIAGAVFSPLSVPANPVTVKIYYSASCDDCHYILERFLPPIQKKYGAQLVVNTYEIENNLDNYDSLLNMEKLYSDEGNEIPVLFIGKTVLGGKEEIEANFMKLFSDELAKEKKRAKKVSPPPVPVSVGKPPPRPPRGTPQETTKITETKTAQAESIYVAYFFKKGCEHCERAAYDLNYLKKRYPLSIKQFDIESAEGVQLWEYLGEKMQIPDESRLGAPAVFVGDAYLLPGQITVPILIKLFEEEMGHTHKKPWVVPEDELMAADKRIRQRFHRFNIFPIIFAGLVDGVNPCAFGALVFFITFLAMAGRKRKEILLVGIAFTIAVFLTYFAIGLGLLKFLVELSFIRTIAHWIYLATAVLALSLGVLSIIDAIRSSKGNAKDMVLQLPDSLKKRIHKSIIKTNEPRYHRNIFIAAFTTGIVVSGLELACTGQVYLPTIIYMTKTPDTRITAIFYLLLYNLMFIVPLVAVFIVVFWGVTSEQLSKFLRNNTSKIKLATALFFFILAFFLWREML